MGGIVGPIETFTLADGTKVPFYALKYDKVGTCVSPKSRDHLIDQLEGGDFTDVYLFSHGWNNTPEDALEAYRTWIGGYRRLLDNGPYIIGRPYRPVVVGVVWPSVWIVPWWERGPNIAAGGGFHDLDDVMARELAEYVPEEKRELFYSLAEGDQLSDEEAREFVGLLHEVYQRDDDELGDGETMKVEMLLDAWNGLSRPAGDPFTPEDEGSPVIVRGVDSSDPQAAGAVVRFPADGIRLFSVWQMKDRAGVVGGNGVADLLRGLMRASAEGPNRAPARIHLIGHSFGARVLLSAICSTRHPDLPRLIDSLLLLQPAINQYGLADSIPGRANAGGFNCALTRVHQPILATFSNDDLPLRKVFHRALRRGRDLGEPQVAADDEPPDEYAAMGGYGPRGVDSSAVIDLQVPGSSYPLGGTVPRVYGVRSHNRITGHGDIANQFTYWALYSLVVSS